MGTPFFPNSNTPGPRGGVSCQKLVEGIYHGCGYAREIRTRLSRECSALGGRATAYCGNSRVPIAAMHGVSDRVIPRSMPCLLGFPQQRVYMDRLQRFRGERLAGTHDLETQSRIAVDVAMLSQPGTERT